MRFKKNILQVSKLALMIWGLISLLIIAYFGGRYLYFSRPSLQSNITKPKKNKVSFVLNWCNLGDERIEEVLESYTSAKALTGDHLDAYSIRISHVTIDELTKNNSSRKWYRGDELPKVVDEAIKFIGNTQSTISWFPSEDRIRTSEYYIYPWSIGFHSIMPTSTKLIIIQPAEKTVFYISSKV